MKKVLLIALLAVGAYFGWEYFLAPAPEASPVARLSQFIDAHVDEILGPLPFEMQGQIPSPAQNHQLRVLREGIRDRQRDAARDEKRLYESAALLCDDLLRAGEERNRHIGRINDTRAKSSASPLATDPEKHRLERLAFFENGIALSWQGASRKLRAVIDQRYRQVRELERNFSEQ
jgi:hypothetical protein